MTSMIQRQKPGTYTVGPRFRSIAPTTIRAARLAPVQSRLERFMPSVIGVMTKPGLMMMILGPVGASSWANPWANTLNPPFAPP